MEERVTELEERIRRMRLDEGSVLSNMSNLPRIKPVHPGTFTGQHDEMIVDTWLFQMHQYFEACKVEDDIKVPYASSLLKEDAAVW